MRRNASPDKKSRHNSMLKDFANIKISVNQGVRFVCDRVGDTTVGKAENLVYQHFLLFSKKIFYRVVKTWDHLLTGYRWSLFQ